jgi:hypothetical protein
MEEKSEGLSESIDDVFQVKRMEVLLSLFISRVLGSI